jgi:DNA/RNA-binding domain of Phe-tRNA-synthetase-like protein
MFSFRITDSIPGLKVALVEALDVQIGAAPGELRARCKQAAEAARHAGLAGGESRRLAIRDLLRMGGYKPSGRSKPAQEYLLRTVSEEGDLPSISNAVDVINLVSLEAGLPISLVSLDRVGCDVCLRYGRPGEKYVFNRTGQELDVEGLLCLCGRGGPLTDASGGLEPVGSPVKDSMKAKVTEEDRHLLACIFASEAAISQEELLGWAEELRGGFLTFCGASDAVVSVHP